MIDVIEKLSTAAGHDSAPDSVTWKSWTTLLKGRCPARRVRGDLKTYLTKCLFETPLNLTFSLYSYPQLVSFVENDEFFFLAAKEGLFVIGDRDLDFACVSLADGSVSLIPGWSITEGQFTKERRYKSLTTFLRGEIKRVRAALKSEQESARRQANFEKESVDDPNAVDARGFTKYHRALMQGDLVAVRRELKRGAKYDTVTGNNSTPFEMAISKGNVDLVRLLLELGCDPNAECKNLNGLTYFHAAMSSAPLDIIELLHQSGGDIERVVDRWGEATTPIVMAITANREDAVTYLLDHGVSATDNIEFAVSMRKCVAVLLANGADPNVNNGAPLKDALMSGNTSMVERLLAAGASLEPVRELLGRIIIKTEMRTLLESAGAQLDITN